MRTVKAEPYIGVTVEWSDGCYATRRTARWESSEHDDTIGMAIYWTLDSLYGGCSSTHMLRDAADFITVSDEGIGEETNPDLVAMYEAALRYKESREAAARANKEGAGDE